MRNAVRTVVVGVGIRGTCHVPQVSRIVRGASPDLSARQITAPRGDKSTGQLCTRSSWIESDKKSIPKGWVWIGLVRYSEYPNIDPPDNMVLLGG